MNLYIFNQTRRGAIYGVGTYIRELAMALKGSDISICVMHLTADKPQIKIEEVDGIKHWYIPMVIQEQRTKDSEQEWELYFRNVVYLLQLHITDKNDLFFHLNFQESGKLAETLKNAFNCKIIATSHFSRWGFTLFDNPQRLRHILKKEQPDAFEANVKQMFEAERTFYLRADHIICLSVYMKGILEDEYGLDSSKITVIPNGLADASIETATKKQLREKWHFAHDEKILLFVGRMDEIKGLSFLLEAFREVLKHNPNCRLVIAGSGDYDKYLKEAKEISAKVSFTGFLASEELSELYQIADMGVVPSLFEPFGYVAVEMMMHRIPIVCTATSGLNEVADDACSRKVPLTVLPDSVEIDTTLLAENIGYLLQNPAVAKQKGINGCERYLTHYTSEIFRQNMLHLYQTVGEKRVSTKIKTLIVTGQNSHTWVVSHAALRNILQNSGLFEVDVAISPKTGDNMQPFKPNFSAYQLVVLDYYGDRWAEETEHSFLNFVEQGGGVVVYHASNNAFRHWKEYNQLIGFGGWENRDETDGAYIYLKDGELFYDHSAGLGGSHGSRHEFELHCGNTDHPITRGLPTTWRHATDELYDRMRGPGMIKDVLYWANSNPKTNGSGRDELVMFTVDYGAARIFHTTLGHAGKSLYDNIAMQCAGFQTTLLRGAEWAATGKVTQPVPNDFPTETTISLRKDYE